MYFIYILTCFNHSLHCIITVVRPMQTAVTSLPTRRSSSPQTPYTLPGSSPRPRRHTRFPGITNACIVTWRLSHAAKIPGASAPHPAANASGIRFTSFQLIEAKRSFLICNLIKTRNLPIYHPSSDAAYRKCM